MLVSCCSQVRNILDANGKVGMGVDGSSSNETVNLMDDCRIATYLQRSAGNPKGTPRVTPPCPFCVIPHCSYESTYACPHAHARRMYSQQPCVIVTLPSRRRHASHPVHELQTLHLVLASGPVLHALYLDCIKITCTKRVVMIARLGTSWAQLPS